MLLKTHGFEFGEFFLDTREKILLRGGKPFQITPKALDLLSVLVENHGHLVVKEDLMQAVWADSFVEDGNLAFTIRLLRKAFDDDAQNPRFIETVPRRGYRFIHEIEKITPETESPKEEINQQPVEKTINKRQSKIVYISAAAVALLITAIAFGTWLIRKNQAMAKFPILNESFSSEKLLRPL